MRTHDTAPAHTAQRAADRAPAHAARGRGRSLPAPLRSRIERLSGEDLSGVQVHHDSPLPAQLQALATTQGEHIHLGPGQQRHLPHEAWHVVQQRQGRVQPTRHLHGTALNDHPALEREADQMSQRALALPDRSEVTPAFDPAAPATRAPAATAPALQRRWVPEGGVVQRAVGFEFETGYKLEKQQGTQWVYLDKGEVVKDYGEGVNLTADLRSTGDSVVEIVLDPPVQEHDPAKFKRALKVFERLGDAFESLAPAKGAAPQPTLLSAVPRARGPTTHRVTPTASGFQGNPQMTVGVAVEKLFSFLDDTSKEGMAAPKPHGDAKYAASQYKGLTASLVARARIEVSAVQGSAELAGLVTLLAIYLKTGARAPKMPKQMLNYAKLISGPYMARTDFAAMFKKLPVLEQQYYRSAPRDFKNLVHRTAGVKGEGGKRLFDRGVRADNRPDQPGFTQDAARTKASPLAFNRRDWLMAITQGDDLTSSSAHPELKDDLEGLGALGDRTDQVGNDADPTPVTDPKTGRKSLPHDKGRGVILELRQMSGAQKPRQFSANAQKIFDYLVDLNR